ncbi:uncharacterized protein LOC119082661 [Bradysia coprophila]|uniref:uncharacterized protein LOC119082661 n=1 Tax=Bradysia coprophila TaxID=38358 RepID=UPI00187D9DE7|nr:uncharacterized protein LOC119082661 [Bradysia coprophila]
MPSRQENRDNADLSVHPSYTNLKIPYDVLCKLAYQAASRKYSKQFLYELKMQEAMQPSAYDAMRFNRYFAITTLWPPLHTRKEIDYTLNRMFTLTPKQQKRLNELMTERQF